VRRLPRPGCRRAGQSAWIRCARCGRSSRRRPSPEGRSLTSPPARGSCSTRISRATPANEPPWSGTPGGDFPPPAGVPKHRPLCPTGHVVRPGVLDHEDAGEVAVAPALEHPVQLRDPFAPPQPPPGARSAAARSRERSGSPPYSGPGD
jgi:hypothetical protein